MALDEARESLVCLDANTGKMKWHFQTIHHGLWDWDIPAQPNLVTITVDGERIDAVAQVKKRGDTFVFDRVTGRPVWPTVSPPYAVVVAIDLNRGDIAWKAPRGEGLASIRNHPLLKGVELWRGRLALVAFRLNEQRSCRRSKSCRTSWPPDLLFHSLTI